jgi:oxalate decarboxylase/phosphoglucose isomerase-like protein (cupin superfamily)
MNSTITKVALAFLVFAVQLPAWPQTNFVTREVLVDNEDVEVVRLTYPPGTESGMHAHAHPNRVVTVVTGGVLEFVPSTGDKPQVLVVEAGMAMYVPAATHNVRNIGDTEVILVETEIK